MSYFELRIAQIIREGGVIYGDPDQMAKDVIAIALEEAARCADKRIAEIEGMGMASSLRVLEAEAIAADIRALKEKI